MRNEATRHDGRRGEYRHHRPDHHPSGHHHHEEGHHGHGGRHEGGPPERRGGHHLRGGDGGPGRDHFGGPRGRARRGEARTILLDALRDGPKHGYEIIKALEERSSGRYAPSPGTVYPTMQLLEDQGLVRAAQEAERRVYSLTEGGRAELEAHADEVADFWARFAGPTTSPASRPEAGFLRDELDELARTVWGGLRDALDRDDPETVRAVRQALARCREEVRSILSSRASSGPRPDGAADLL